MPIRGTLLDVLPGALVFIAANLSLGLLISTVVQNQFQAMQLTFFFFLPSILLSGFMFPFDGMPQRPSTLPQVLPLTHFLRMMRGIMLRGADVADMLPPLYALLAFFGVTMSLAILRFRKRLD